MKPKPAKRKTEREKDRLAGRSAEMQLYRAVRRYVLEKGGNVVVIGGIQMQEWPHDPAFTFRVAVSVTGRKPVFEAAR